MMLRPVLSCLLAGVLALGCGDGDDDTPMSDGPPVVMPPDSGTYYHFVTTELLIPNKSATYSLDLDNDTKVDTGLSGLIGVLDNVAPLPLQMTMDMFLEQGAFVLLHSLRADDLANDSSVSWQVFRGEPTATPPDFGSNPMFSVASDSPTDALLIGTIRAGELAVGPVDTVKLPIPVEEGMDPILLELRGVRIQGDISASCNQEGDGEPLFLAGGIREEELRDNLLPAFVSLMNGIIDGDCGPQMDVSSVDECECVDEMGETSTGETILSFLDGKAPAPANTLNCRIEVAEILDNPLAGDFLEPRVDLFNAQDEFAPGEELAAAGDTGDRTATYDSIAFSVGVRCAPAQFTAPGE